MMKAMDKVNGRKELHNYKGSSFLLGAFFLNSSTPLTPIAKHALSAPYKSREGHWVPDLNSTLYNSTSCLTIPDSKNCFKHGRKDVDFLNWRWKPDQCDLSRFDPSKFLQIVRGKKLAFVGDSVARNHMESLLCLLSQVETPIDEYKDKEDHFRTWKFPSSNFILMILWSRFLVKHEERVINGSNSGMFNLHIDQVDQDWASNLQGINYIVISDAHWFFRKNYLYKRNKIIGCVYCSEPDVKTLTLNDALRMALNTALSYIDNCDECGDVLTILRTFSPAHFENGSWDTGGNCNRTSPYGTDQMDNIGKFEMELRSLQMKELENVKKKRFVGLDVTKAMLMRPDAHPSSYWGNKWMKGYNDCVHWCMPGPIDVWSDLLMAVLQREVR
ncbi:hypothetical protein V2J09_013639 [Rumex salicifolius]